MSHPDLFALLRGELDNAEVTTAGDHLEDCAECRTELAGLAVGHALLSQAVRTVTGAARVPDPPSPLPPLRPVTGPRASRRIPTLLVAAAAVVAGAALGAAGVTALGGSDEDGPAPPRPAYASVPLTAVEGSAAGEARMVEESGRRTRMVIEASDLRGAGHGRFYYAWLLDPDTDKMLPLGQVASNGTASFDVDNALLKSYSAIDVSLEDDDGDPAHSVTSVLRGTYDADGLPSAS